MKTITLSVNLSAVLILTAVVVLAATPTMADTFGSGANMFGIEFVTIGNPDNAADTTGTPNPAGKVPYNYRIGKFEISEDMMNKANTLGSLGITHDNRGDAKPVTDVSWNEAARFVNWLNTSQGFTPAYKFAVQPGEGGYDRNANIQLWQSGDVGYDPNNFYRNSLATYFLPSVHEWYKAAFYDPNANVYFLYPTGSDTLPTAVASGTAADTAVFAQSNFTGPADIILAGGSSPYGTIGQGGNVWEWEETAGDLMNASGSSFRGQRGDSWTGIPTSLSSSGRAVFNPVLDGSNVGFRVASVIPEPTTCGLALAATLFLAIGRRRPH